MDNTKQTYIFYFFLNYCYLFIQKYLILLPQQFSFCNAKKNNNEGIDNVYNNIAKLFVYYTLHDISGCI